MPEKSEPVRCSWGASDPDYIAYHDTEWGRPVLADAPLFEKLCLEGFQSGLSWLTILRKRPRFREVFHDFDIEKVAAMGEPDIERLLQDAGIIRHRGKIASTINNAKRARDIQREFGSLAAYIWGFEPARGKAPAGGDIPAHTAASHALSKDLRKRGFSFVGPTTCYAFMQAMGLVNDHIATCFCRAPCEAEREKLKRPLPS
jgi:DNA-3-methyladenine glycosylase I